MTNIIRRARGPQFASDNINVSYHGYVHSHLDALCHTANDHKIFNGAPMKSPRDEVARTIRFWWLRTAS